MKMILKTYKYRLYPSKEQEEILARYFGTVRFVYNHFLAERKRQYEEDGKSDNYYIQAKTLTNLKKQEEYSWIKEIKIKEHRTFKGKVKNMTISVTPSGKYFVSILSKVEYKPVQKTNAKVGIDLGIKDLVITSDGIKYSSNKFIKYYSKELAKAQKHLSKKTREVCLGTDKELKLLKSKRRFTIAEWTNYIKYQLI